jgi:hypothetical protein
MLTPEILSTIRPGTRLTILVPNGKSLERIDGKATGKIVQDWKESIGKVVIVNGNGTFALNMGGRFGIPGYADARNIVKIASKRVSTATKPE